VQLAGSHPFLFFDYLRVPYSQDADAVATSGEEDGLFGHIHDADSGRTLWWPRADAQEHLGLHGGYKMGPAVVFGRVLPDNAVASFLVSKGAGWKPNDAIVDTTGSVVAHIWGSRTDDVVLPFDPGETMVRCWSEGYKHLRFGLSARVRVAMVHAYYHARPAIPRAMQIRMRRAFASIQGRATFPAWPIEDGLHDLFDWLFDQVVGLTGGPVPWVDPWPDGRSWSFVLTHDVDTQKGFDSIDLLRDIERESGRTSSWNIVPERYTVADSVLDNLREQGCEIGLHGLHHDGRDLESLRTFETRLPAMRDYAARWGAVGFRSPATHRVWEWMPRLGLDYDTSYPDTDPYEPTPGGSCSYLPFMNRSMVELPITLPQDHTLFAILQQADASLWVDKARHIRDRDGMALLITHPDYADDQRVVDSYQELLQAFAKDRSVWWALPREVSAWWRQRGASQLKPTPTGWKIDGPAAKRARVRYATHGAAESCTGS
jgi:hypothetical protein